MFDGRRRFVWLTLAGLLVTGCAAVEPGGHPDASGGRGWPAPPPPSPPAPEWPAPERGNAYLLVEPTPLDFGSVEVGRAAEIEGFLSNRGSADAGIASVEVNGRDLRLMADGCSGRRLSPGETCPFRVRYSPGDAGPAGGEVVIFVADPLRRQFQVDVVASARLPRRAEIDLRFDPAEIFFGEVELGDAVAADLAIRNAGDEPVRLRDLAVDGREFTIRQDGCSGETVRPRRECRVQVVYSPARRGRATGALQVRPDGRPGGIVLSVPLAGEGREQRGPDIQLSTQELDFGAVAVGEARVQEVRISNAGKRDLRLRGLRAEGQGFSLASDGCSGRALGPGRECAFAVGFEPVAPGAVEGRIVVPSDDRDERAVAIHLSGRGREAQRCAVVQLKLRWDRDSDPDPLVVSGQLPRGECLTYALEIKRAGRLIVCVPPGYELAAQGFEFVKGGECKVADDPLPYQRYRRLGIEAGTEIKDLTLRRQDDARRQFRVLLQFRTQQEGSKARED